jgi:hypothetical protein
MGDLGVDDGVGGVFVDESEDPAGVAIFVLRGFESARAEFIDGEAVDF